MIPWYPACCSTKKILSVHSVVGVGTVSLLDSDSVSGHFTYLDVRISFGPLLFSSKYWISLQTSCPRFVAVNLCCPTSSARQIPRVPSHLAGLVIIKYRYLGIRELLEWSSTTSLSSHIPDCTNMRLQVPTLTPWPGTACKCLNQTNPQYLVCLTGDDSTRGREDWLCHHLLESARNADSGPGTRTLLNQLSWSVNPGQLHYPLRSTCPPSLPPHPSLHPTLPVMINILKQ